MSRAQFSHLMHPAKGRILITGHFHPAAGNAPTGLTGEGVASIVRDGAGEFTLTLDDDYSAIEWADAHLGMASAADSVVQVGAIVADPSTGGSTIKLHTLTAGVAADIAANANNTVFFAIVAKRDAIS